MGSDLNVTRVLMPVNTSHLDHTDLRFLPQEIRQALGLDSVVDGDNLHAIMVDFVLGFVDTLNGQRNDWSPSVSFIKFAQDVESLDASYVADWAQNAMLDPTSSAFLTDAGFAMLQALCAMLSFAMLQNFC